MPQPTVHAATLAAIRAELTNVDPALRAQAIEALALLGDRRGLLAALRSPHAYVRRTAARGLADASGTFITWRLARLASDPDASVRGAVAQALTERSSGRAHRTLKRLALHDTASSVRFLALVGLERSDAPGVDAVLATIAAEDGAEQLGAMARALLRRRRGHSR